MNNLHLVEQLERRFGYRELPETAKMQFDNTTQGTEELLDDWVDMVLTLAGKTFRELLEDYTINESINKCCHRVRDKESGESVANMRPTTIEEALDKVKWAVYTHTLMYGNSRRLASYGIGSDN